MRKIAFFTALAVSALAGANAASAMTLTSPDIRPGGRMADEQALDAGDCGGRNISPELDWSGAPKGTKSFAVSVLDPDAPTGGFWHWWVANIPAGATALSKGAGDARGAALPAGSVQIRNDFGAIGYGGPCPPTGKPHHYRVTVYALDVDRIDVGASASAAALLLNVRAHTLASAALTSLWGR